MTDEQSIYDELEVPTVINAASTKTRIGGSLIRPEAVEAMASAAESFVRISDLQARASDLISEVTGAEAGYVASGAAACLTLGTAACIADTDLKTMDELPLAEGAANEVIMPRSHRNGYDHAIRLAGAKIVDVGNNDNHLGTGSVNTELWEIEAAITEKTAAVAYMQKSYSQPDLEDVCAVAHEHDVPVIVDAAAELPPKRNLSRFIDEGADLVVFSGGKAIRGPQASGILAGREDLIESAAMQHLDMHVAEDVWEPPANLIDLERFAGVPRQGVGRPLKVGKEEIAGLIRALQLFVDEDHDARVREWTERTDGMASALREEEGLSITVTEAEKTAVAPEVYVTLDPEIAGIDVETLVAELRTEDPRVFVGPDYLHESAFTVNPMCLTDEEAEYVVERIRSYLA
ncbi:aminotransferase class V-fold PLP-dependent enzyme [Natrononativus amylolyticus]|uniref:aminotransferase class V-fold PLP-dependent enzyme n=1 Tax=Natrononativus amylolyticus TaxID=2963434 RepID=UPI0020CC43CF|nr:aminotransferase class V-fold PLP-dependent enzyme [Natrononativus amylolyticus]